MSTNSTLDDGNLFDPIQFSLRLRRAMKYEDKSMRSMEPEVDISRRSLARIASGHPPSVESYLRILRWLLPVEKKFK